MNNEAVARLLVDQYRDVCRARAMLTAARKRPGAMGAMNAGPIQVATAKDDLQRASEALRTTWRMHLRQLATETGMQEQ